MVELLFNTDPYLKETGARVTRVDGNKIFLDQTIFFAFSGGQASDSGSIDGAKVVDVVKENNDIAHVVENNIFSEGQAVHLKIDWERRHKLMRLHSAAHIVGVLFWEKHPGTKMIGSNISVDKSRLDYEFDKPVTEMLPGLESEANQIINQGLEIKTYVEQEGSDRRVWEMPAKNWMMPCGGTHVKNTSEIGQIKLKRKNLGACKERIEVALA